MPKSKRNSTFNLTRTEKKTKKVKENLYSKIQECTEKYKFLFLFHVENMRNSFMKELRIQFNQDR
jgi:mRNA turnover protein 4